MLETWLPPSSLLCGPLFSLHIVMVIVDLFFLVKFTSWCPKLQCRVTVNFLSYGHFSEKKRKILILRECASPCNHQDPGWSSHDMLWPEIDMTGLSGQPAMICRASDRPPPWARSASHESEQMLCQSANHRWASRKRWHHRQIRAHAVTFWLSCPPARAASSTIILKLHWVVNSAWVKMLLIN